MTNFTFNGRGVAPDRPQIITTIGNVSTVTGIADQILVIGHITDRVIGMTSAGTGSIIGVTGVTGKLDTVTSCGDMFAMSCT